jgi:aspartyl-tRNA(Asn)/glutamyl-tRNA(Gln) amidotransferase subunit B
MEYIPTIGLEIHCELKTGSKMFCSCPNNPEELKPNKNVCPVCLGHPGTLPVANEDAIRKVRLVGLALGSKVLTSSKFDRKNYFYPDLPKGYQISQYDLPLCLGGVLEIGSGDSKKTVGITRVHMEEDTGKLSHPDGADYSLVDFNRGGVPLMELVTEPDIENAAQARDFVKELQMILRYLEVSDADMEKGEMRVEVNISLSPKDNGGKKALGTKVEIKNLNSLKAVEGSVAYEIVRQGEILEQGGKVAQETRGWHDVKQITFSQREKEEAFDYRYFPEPDIPPMTISEEEIGKLKGLICELPAQKRLRFAEQYGLTAPAIAEIFIVNRAMADYFEKAISEAEEWINVAEADRENTEGQKFLVAQMCANYLASDVRGILAGAEFCSGNFKVTPENFAEFIKLIYKKEISSKIAKAVLAKMAQTGADPSDIIEKEGLSQITDPGQINAAVDGVLEKNPKAAADYKAGKAAVFQFLVGQVLAATKGRANPDMVKKTLLDKLSK